MRLTLDGVHLSLFIQLFFARAFSLQFPCANVSGTSAWGMVWRRSKILHLNSARRKMDAKVRLRIKKPIPRAAEQRQRPRLQQNIFLIVLLCKKKMVVMEGDDGEKMLWKLHIVKYCQWFITCLLIAPAALSALYTNGGRAGPGSGFLPTEACQSWPLIQMYVLAQEQRMQSTSFHECF